MAIRRLSCSASTLLLLLQLCGTWEMRTVTMLLLAMEITRPRKDKEREKIAKELTTMTVIAVSCAIRFITRYLIDACCLFPILTTTDLIIFLFYLRSKSAASCCSASSSSSSSSSSTASSSLKRNKSSKKRKRHKKKKHKSRHRKNKHKKKKKKRHWKSDKRVLFIK